jgi:nickel-dependent lactate racemase
MKVVGFSGGTKYFFPGIAGPELIDFTHWLGALLTSYRLIGVKRTAVRDVINRAATFIETSKLFCCLVVMDEALAGLYIGDSEAAWS